MRVYWSILLMTLIVVELSYTIHKRAVVIGSGQKMKLSTVFSIIAFGYITFFVGLRDVVLDTWAYINNFNLMPITLDGLKENLASADGDAGFILMQFMFKKFISDNHYFWLMFLCIVCCICILKGLRYYSEDIPFSIFLFVSSTTFTWLINGMRQFLAVCVLFGFSNLWLTGHKKKYLLLMVLMTTIHSSVWFIVPIMLFVSSKKIWDKRMQILIVITVVGTYYSDRVFNFINEVYVDDYSLALETGNGSNFFRLLIAAVPLVIVILSRKCVEERADEKIKFAVNMSLVNFCFYFAASFTNGILVGRMPIYFTVYTFCLLPWLINNCFTNRTKRLMKIMCMVFYVFYFYYQMEIAWEGLTYVSYILNIYYW